MSYAIFSVNPNGDLIQPGWFSGILFLTWTVNDTKFVDQLLNVRLVGVARFAVSSFDEIGEIFHGTFGL